MDQPSGLISVLLDKSARLDERDDAAMDLGAFDEPEAESALRDVAEDSTEDYLVLSSAGASLGEIWVRRGWTRIPKPEDLQPVARVEAMAVLTTAGERREVKKRWESHLASEFPPSARGKSVGGVDLVLLDAEGAALVISYLGRVPFDHRYLARLNEALSQLRSSVARLDDPERRYFAELREILASVRAAIGSRR